MTEVTALEKRLCPSCGGQAVWNPGKSSLMCEFCGTAVPMDVKEGEVVEHDLVAALRNISDDKRGWQAEKQSVRCQHCEAISVFDAGRVGQRCDFCGSTQLVPYQETKAPFRPESLMTLKISEVQAREVLRAWYRKVWFAPNNLNKLSLADTFKGVYLPFWTFDAHVDADWAADAGYYYYTSEEYTDSEGKRQTRRVQHTRWERASGHVSHFFDDELIPASAGVDASLIERCGPFPTDALIPYDAAYLSGWTVEHYQIDLVEAAKSAQKRMESKITSMCSDKVPGDTQRGLRVEADFSAQTFKHILAPVWLATYTYGARSYQVLINGVTGNISGYHPRSWVKITLAVLAVLLVAGVFLFFAGQQR